MKRTQSMCKCMLVLVDCKFPDEAVWFTVTVVGETSLFAMGDSILKTVRVSFQPVPLWEGTSLRT